MRNEGRSASTLVDKFNWTWKFWCFEINGLISYGVLLNGDQQLYSEKMVLMPSKA